MNIAVILLTQNRADLTKRVIAQNFFNSGYDAHCYLVDNGSTEEQFREIHWNYNWYHSTWHLFKRGIAAGVNFGLALTTEYDAVCILANDILLPDNWLKAAVDHSKKIKNTGIIGWHCVEALPPLVDGIHKTHTPFGNNFITRELIDVIGGYNKEYDPYGMQDRDFAERATIAGFTNYYLPDMSSVHIGHDVGENSDYRRMKDESLARAEAIWQKNQPIYHTEKKIKCEF